jgi:hypothetical protein
MPKIHELKANEWRTADELAEDLGITRRSVFRRLSKGRVESQETAEGTRYRLSDASDVTSVTSSDSDLARAIATATETNSKLVDDLAAARTRIDDLVSRLTEAERKAITWRARYHVARGRVEMEEE